MNVKYRNFIKRLNTVKVVRVWKINNCFKIHIICNQYSSESLLTLYIPDIPKSGFLLLIPLHERFYDSNQMNKAEKNLHNMIYKI